MNAKDILGKKIIDKQARDLAKLAEINLNTKTLEVTNIFGSVGNPLSKKYYDIPVSDIITVGDYIQVSRLIEDLESSKLDKLPETEAGVVKLNNFLGKTILDTEGNVAGKMYDIEIDIDTHKILSIELSSSSTTFGKPKDQKTVKIEDISSIGDYILINKVFTEESEESEEEKESVKVDIK